MTTSARSHAGEQDPSGRSPVLDMHGITKRFGATHALRDVDLSIFPGEVLGLVGENGAGKSTIMKILSGAYSKDDGEIRIRGKAVDLRGPAHAQELGIAIIYQELSLFPDLTAVENIFVRHEKCWGGRPWILSPLDRRAMRDRTLDLLREDLGVVIDVDVPVSRLSLAEKQLIEIARALHSRADIIIMDEPTEALEAEEREQLFATVRRLKDAGKSVIYVSHQLDQVVGLCDRITVLRDGNHVSTAPTDQVDVATIISLMIGGSLEQQYPTLPPPAEEAVLQVEDLTLARNFEKVSFAVRRGEILGIAGLNGSGKNALVRSVYGIRPPEKGTVAVAGRQVTIRSPKDATACGLAFLPAERKTEGVFTGHSIRWNLTIAGLRRTSRLRLRREQERQVTNRYTSELGVKATSGEQEITLLSGGNQQKVLLARWLAVDPEVFILEEPTRGIDVSAKADVYRHIADYARRGKSFVVVSSESPELLGICHRVLVMYEGRVAAVLDAGEATQELIAHYSVQRAEEAADE
ncbi:sugar ABC transporter ATP-binding protein [Streptomyces sp. NPDC048420]|uniref:sugar ABC transporter ATP-binding protein n=1 Tax=Streptomyces sp. NPDC048420 TaxID=3155755 RepID=UPI0034394F07